MNPTELIAWTSAGGAVMALVIRGGTWLFASLAARSTDRRLDLNMVIARQDGEIADLKKEMAEEQATCAARIRALEDRVIEAERAAARMEGVLYRLGYERSGQGWQRSDDRS